MNFNGVIIDDTFAEAFDMRATRVIVTALNETWVMHSVGALTGFATSVIGCGCEAGLERLLPPGETPDGRPGAAVLIFAMDSKGLIKQLENRIGQTVLTCPTTAAFAGIEGEPIGLGRGLRFFGDGFQLSKVIDGRRFWRVPVMDGEFLCEESTGMVGAVGGGNFLVLAETQAQALAACEAAIEAMDRVPGVIMPFPGGVVRSGSKIGSKYKALTASTNDAYCPTLRGLTRTALSDEVGAVLEIVIDGLTDADIRQAMRAGIQAICTLGRPRGIRRISAGNFGGKLGRFHFHLREIMA
jgi:formylmethanofuran--tetrahydromethanopterin N-formyltransferase